MIALLPCNSLHRDRGNRNSIRETAGLDLESGQSCFANDACDLFERHQVRIEDQMVQQRIFQILAKVPFQITFSATVLGLNLAQGHCRGEAMGFLKMFHSTFQRGDQTHMKHMRKTARDEICSAANQDDVALFGQVENGFGRLLDES